MIGATNGFDDSDTGLTATGLAAGSPEAIARALSREFSAPVGILDSQGRRWSALVGATESQFPAIGDPLVRRSHASDLGLGQAAVWRSREDSDRVWLLIPLPGVGGIPEVAIAGFRAGADSAKNTPAWDEDTRDYAMDLATWGPACPDPALRAWGQQAADRLRSQQPSRKDPQSPFLSTDGENSGVVISRLTRRLRISDPPHLFQNVATTVLRTSLNVQAVAWVPKAADDQVVVSGSNRRAELTGLPIVPVAQRAGIDRHLPGCGDRPSRRGTTVGCAGTPPIAAGSVGWLLAVNPLDDRAISPADIERLQYVGSLIVAQLSNARIYADLKELLFGIIRA